MITITLSMLGGIIDLNGRRIACPQCGEQSLLTVRAMPDEAGDEPSYVQCPWDHVWAEPAAPRWALAEFFAACEREDPELWAELLRVHAERGSLSL